jgi:outer membrane protein OmpA-like peptidoglycan-associated protein
MRHSSLVLPVVSALLFSSNVLAEASCPFTDDGKARQPCEHPEWRGQATMSDNSVVRTTGVAENTERVLPRAKVTLWALPPLPSMGSRPYSDDDLHLVKVGVTQQPSQFGSAIAALDPEMIKRVSTLVEQLKDKQNVKLHFTGHTDNQLVSIRSQHWYKDNKALSTARAKAVADYFKQVLDLPEQAISYSGMGDSQPIASNSTPAGMAKNRRVDMDVWYQSTDVKKAVISSTMSKRQICKGEIQPVITRKGGFRISVDGQPVDSSAKGAGGVQRCTDVALSKANIRLQYDNHSVKPMLDVSAWPASAMIGETIKFQGYSNYMAWVDHAEVRIFEENRSEYGEPLVIVPLDDALAGQWIMTVNAPKAMHYRIRVYDREDHFDETMSLPLLRIASHRTPDDKQLTDQQKQTIAYGNSRLQQQSIPVAGGTVTVHGDSVPKEHQVGLMGLHVPVDPNGKFVARQIIPNGQHTLEVAALDEQGNGALFWRDIEFKSDDWFFVGIIDATVGHQSRNGPVREVTQDKHHFDNGVYVDGRIAFYTKGKWLDKYTITASADTREQAIDKLFSTFTDKDPRSLLRRLDDTEYYPVYGDDSTLVQDAPTQGKFYGKIEDERSHAMWGNFKIVQQETDLAQINRGLYGAVVDWNSEAVTSDSNSQSHVNLFVAEPGTLAAREEFRGTGGSLYYLEHQDIVRGSERIQVEIRDKDSGIVLSVNSLVAGQDYQEDAIQGRILLTRPLPSTADDSQLVRAGSYAGNSVYLVVDYEYTGGLAEISDLAFGGRATHWLNDSIRVGVTGTHQERLNQDQNLYGLDVLFRKTTETYLRLEAATTKGPGVNSNSSIDGGYQFTPTAVNPTDNKSANAYQLESGFRFDDLGFDIDGHGNLYLRYRDKGFSAPGQLTTYETWQVGTAINLPFSEQDSVNIKFDLNHQNKGVDSEVVQIDLRHKIDEDWSVSAGFRGDNRKDNRADNTTSTNNIGERADLTVQLDYGVDQDWGIYGFGQATLYHDSQRNKNNRGGLGGYYQANDRLGLNGEVSMGSVGFGALVGADYRLSERTNTYLNYALDPDNANSGIGNRQGKMVAGVRNRYSDWLSVYGEEQVLHGDSGDGLTHSYGVDLTVNEQWSLGMAVESGHIRTDTNTTKRRAVSLSTNYLYEDVKYGGNFEYRHDKTDDIVRDTWLARNHLAYQVNPDWRMRAQIDMAFSESDEGDFFDANFIEAVVGYAYRPVNNDKFNALLEYKYLYDQAPADQFTGSGAQNDFEQRSHVFAVDGIYDLTSRFSLGAKYAIRLSELRLGRGEGDWFSSIAQLGVLRLDWHVIKNWDALIEGRVLDISEAEDRKSGFLTAVYRHFGENVKAGVGYNFTDFSDDLTDLSYDSHGVFFNVIGKW